MSGHSERLRLEDINKSKLLYKLLIELLETLTLEAIFTKISKENSKLDFRSLISITFTTFECILVPKYENPYFQAMFTVLYHIY